MEAAGGSVRVDTIFVDAGRVDTVETYYCPKTDEELNDLFNAFTGLGDEGNEDDPDKEGAGKRPASSFPLGGLSRP